MRILAALTVMVACSASAADNHSTFRALRPARTKNLRAAVMLEEAKARAEARVEAEAKGEGEGHSFRPSHKIQARRHNGTGAAVGKDINIYCFAFCIRSFEENLLIRHATLQLGHCDGSNIFTNAPDGNERHLSMEEQRKSIGDGSIIWATNTSMHKGHNMKGIRVVWALLLGNTTVARGLYDWVVNTEVDHYVRVSRLRSALDTLRKREERLATLPALMTWRNVVMVNRRLVLEIIKQWQKDSFPSTCNSLEFSSSTGAIPVELQCRACECAQDEFFPHLFSRSFMTRPRDVLELTSALVQRGHVCEVGLFDLQPGWKSAGGHKYLTFLKSNRRREASSNSLPALNASRSTRGSPEHDRAKTEARIIFLKKFANFVHNSTLKCSNEMELPDRDLVFFHHIFTPALHETAEGLIGF